jgi:hypothetical protein
LENTESMDFRLRQMLRVSIPLFRITEAKFSLFFQDEIFLRINNSWAGARGFDQNRFTVGVEYARVIRDVPVTFSAGYMNMVTPNKVTHAVNVGVRATIPQRKKKPLRIIE